MFLGRPPSIKSAHLYPIQDVSRRREGGAQLMHLFKSMLAVGKISNSDFCQACYFASMAGCCGAEFTKYGLRPGCQSGKYARLFSSFTKPPPDMFETVSVPTRPSPKNDKYVSDYKMSLIHESLFEEIQEHPELLDATNAGMYPDCYHEHPVTRDCLARGEAPPLALALYTDGVRYTSPLNSNAVTTCGYWVINVASGKRHLLTELRGNRVCSCGCRGWCSSWVVLRYLK